jgi:hypothetical protein
MGNTFVLYTCPVCGIKERQVPIPGRPTGTPLEKWMLEMGRRIGMDHGTVAPLCANLSMDLMLPTKHPNGTDKEWVGQEDL